MWYYSQNNTQMGPVSEQELVGKLASGELPAEALVWCEGMANWAPAAGVPELVAARGASGGLSMPSPGMAPANPYAAPQAVLPSSMATGGAELATLGQRLGAVLVEFLVALPGGILVGAGVGMQEQSGEGPGVVGLAMLAVGGLYLLGLLVYNLVRLTTHGQSIGKQIVKIKIVKIEDDSNPGFVKAVLLRGFVNGLIGAVPLLGPIYSLVDICFIFTQSRRCIHDLIAGTRVVKC